MCERGLVNAPLDTSRFWKPMIRCKVSSRCGVSMIFQRATWRKLTSRMSRLSVGSRSLPKGRSPASLLIQVTTPLNDNIDYEVGVVTWIDNLAGERTLGHDLDPTLNLDILEASFRHVARSK